MVQTWPGGWPGPAVHGLMQQRLKGRQLEQVPHHFGISGSQTERVVYLAGRRRSESKVRATVPHFEEKGTVLWSSPIAIWHKADLRAYRLRHAKTKNPVPVNTVAQLLGMSGECGCCANAVDGERERWIEAYPNDPFILQVLAMEEELKPRTDIPDHRKIWCWGGTDEGRAAEAEYQRQQKAEPVALPDVDGVLCNVNCGPDFISDLMDPLYDLEDVA
jgi:3'-phosphoadenosine 5'-phosphosulfate sulfotransferase (PAPS reductase)/FAD synthetase